MVNGNFTFHSQSDYLNCLFTFVLIKEECLSSIDQKQSSGSNFFTNLPTLPHKFNIKHSHKQRSPPHTHTHDHVLFPLFPHFPNPGEKRANEKQHSLRPHRRVPSKTHSFSLSLEVLSLSRSLSLLPPENRVPVPFFTRSYQWSSIWSLVASHGTTQHDKTRPNV